MKPAGGRDDWTRKGVRHGSVLHHLLQRAWELHGTTGRRRQPCTASLWLQFPVVTIRDMVRVQCYLLDHLGVSSLLAVTGGSMADAGAAVGVTIRARPTVIALASPPHSAQQIAFNEVAGRRSWPTRLESRALL